MRKVLLVVIAFHFLCLNAFAATSPIFTYSGDILPTADGWSKQGSESYATIEGGTLHLNDNGTSGGSYIQYYKGWTVEAGCNYIAEFDVKVVSDENIYIFTGDGNYHMGYTLFVNKIASVSKQGAGLDYLFNTTTAFNTYKATLENGVARLYINGTLVLEQTAGTGPYQYVGTGVEFGAGGSANTGNAYFDEIRAYKNCNGELGLFQLPDTGQTKCYDGAGGEIIPCPVAGDPLAQDGSYDINPMSYQDNGDGTVLDNNTGLIWQKCSVGQNNDSTCSGNAIQYNWYQASGTYDATYNSSSQNICAELGAGWRLPMKKELMSIVDYSIPWPGLTVQTILFPHTQASGYWSSTTLAYYPSDAWYVDFDDGYVYDGNKGNSYYVRCVRTVQLDFGNYVDNHDETITDISTGLMWQRGETGAKTWQAALEYCENLELPSGSGQQDWRLPNIKELASIIDDSIYDPINPIAIDRIFFPNAYASYYWSSTTNAYNPRYAWDVYFGNGDVDVYTKGNHLYVRCVRGGQGGNPPTSLKISDIVIQPANLTLGTAVTISGVLSDENNNPVPDTTFGVEDPITQASRQITSISDGTFTVTTAVVADYRPFIFPFIAEGINIGNVNVNVLAPTLPADTFVVNDFLFAGGLAMPLEPFEKLFGYVTKNTYINSYLETLPSVAEVKGVGQKMWPAAKQYIKDHRHELVLGAKVVGAVAICSSTAGVLCAVAVSGVIADSALTGADSLADYACNNGLPPDKCTGVKDALYKISVLNFVHDVVAFGMYSQASVDDIILQSADTVNFVMDLSQAENIARLNNATFTEGNVVDYETDANGNLLSFTLEGVNAKGDVVYMVYMLKEQNNAVKLLSPDTAGAVIPAGSTEQIRWGAQPEAVKFNLEYSCNDLAWKKIAYNVQGNAYNWPVPVFLGNKKNCKIKVTGFNSSGGGGGMTGWNDVSDNTFTIEVIGVNTPNGGEVWRSREPRRISWDAWQTVRPVSKVNIYLKGNGTTTYQLIKTLNNSPFGPAYWDWTIPDVAKTRTGCRIKVELRDANNLIVGNDISDANFTIKPVGAP